MIFDFLEAMPLGKLAIPTFSVWFTKAMLIASSSTQTGFTLTSQAFENKSSIPDAYSCKGDNLSPELSWKGSPPDTKTFALIVSDPDAPSGEFIHWMIYNIPSNIKKLPQGVEQNAVLDGGAAQGVNHFQRIGYDGPCPPKGQRHSYIFTLYALDTKLHLDGGSTLPTLKKAMEGHILAKTTLTGYFETPK